MKILIQTFSLMPNLEDNEATKEAEENIIIIRVEVATSNLLNRRRVKTITKFLV